MYFVDWVSEEAVAYIKNADIDVVFHTTEIKKSYTPKQFEKYLSMAKKYDLPIYMPITAYSNELAMSDKKLADFASKYARDDSVFGYYLIDEPHIANPWARVERVLKVNSPNKVPLLNFLPNTEPDKMDCLLKTITIQYLLSIL